jgi:hypothetical protein
LVTDASLPDFAIAPLADKLVAKYLEFGDLETTRI